MRAARIAGLRTIPVILRAGVNKRAMIELALIVNIQRQDLGAIEKRMRRMEPDASFLRSVQIG